MRFHIDCSVYTPTQTVSVFLGVFNIVIWAVAMIPQLAENYRNKDVGALSPYYLLLWYSGRFRPPFALR